MRTRTRLWPYWLSAAAALLAAACGGPARPAPEAAPTPIEVRTGRVGMRPVARTFTAGGVVRAQTTAQVTSRIVGEVREVRVRTGDRVRRGQIVVVLDDRDLAAHRAQADASLAAARSAAVSADAGRDAADAGLVLAKVHYGRIQQLRDRNSAIPAELDRATADLRIAEGTARSAAARSAEAAASVTAAEAAARAAEAAASYSIVAAPFDGLVTSTHTEPGNMASPGLLLLSIEAVDGFRLEFQADEARVRSLRQGDTVDVELEGAEDGRTTSGRIVEVARAIDPASHAFTVKVTLPSAPAIRSGMFARAHLRADLRDALVVPASALVRRGQLSLVYVLDEGHARMRAVTPGAAAGDAVEILAGLAAGEVVVMAPPSALTDGAPIRVAGGTP